MKNRIMIIDALNMYYRAYIVDPSLSSNGQPIGGIKGFLKILQKLCREIKPDQIAVIWDGGSSRRRSKDKNYKEGRKPIRLNRAIRNLSENEELQNKMWQQARLVEYLNKMPISQILIDNLEADDIIGAIMHLSSLNGTQKVIVSADKDFIQLCNNEDVVLFRPVQKEVLNEKRIVEQYGIHPNNFALARAICGDKSDNLGGVGNVGLKTISKRFPFLSDPESHVLETIVSECKSAEQNLKVYKNILENQDLIKKNYSLMQLYTPSISVSAKNVIRGAIDDLDFSLNKTKLRAMMIEDGFGAYDWSDLFLTCQRIIANRR